MTTTIELTVDLTNRAEIVKNDGLLIASKTMLDAAQRLRELDKPDTKKKKNTGPLQQLSTFLEAFYANLHT